MLREYLEAIPFAVAALIVAVIAFWLYTSYGPLAVVGGVVGVFGIVIGRVVWSRRRTTRAFAEVDREVGRGPHR